MALDEQVERENIRKIFAESLAVDVSDARDSANFINDLKADSLDIQEASMEIEETYNISFPQDYNLPPTVGEAINDTIEYIRNSQ